MNKKQLNEIKYRDFLEIEDNFRKNKSIISELRYGYYWETTPMVTVVIPVYGRLELAQIAIESILNQSFTDFQLLIVDDEATGEEVNAIEKYVRKIDNKHIIYFKNRVNLGLYANWNRCVLLSKSKWVCMVHSDTFLKKDFLKNSMDILSNKPGIYFLNNNKEEIKLNNINELEFEKYFFSKVDTSKYLKKYTFFDYNFHMRSCIQGSVFDREKFIQLGGIKSDGSYVEDYPFLVKFAYFYGVYYDSRKNWVDCLYDNFGANTEIWQEQLVYNYYLYRFISNCRFWLIRKLFLKKSRLRIIEEAIEYNSGKSWIGKECNIDLTVLMKDCGIKKIKKLSYVESLIMRIVIKLQG